LDSGAFELAGIGSLRTPNKVLPNIPDKGALFSFDGLVCMPTDPDYLRERRIEAKNTAAIVKEEGLENLYSICRKKRKAKAAPQVPSAASLSTPAKPTLGGHNDRQVVLPFRMKLSDRDELFEPTSGTLLTVLVSRVTQGEADFQIVRIARGDHLSEQAEAEDWED
jgi:hypothetical protein